MSKRRIVIILGLIAVVIVLALVGHLSSWSFLPKITWGDPTQTDQLSQEGESLVDVVRDDASESSQANSGDSTADDFKSVANRELDVVDPELDWDALVNDGEANISQVDGFLSVASAWASQDGMKVVDRVRDSLGFSAVADVVVLSILHDAVQTDPAAAFQSALSLSSQSRKDALVSIVAMWAKTNPSATLQALNSANLGGLSNELQESLVEAWSENDPKDLLANISSLPDHLQHNAEMQAMLGVARIAPPDAVEFLSKLPDDPNDDRRYDLALETAEHWSQIDANAALNWVSSIPFPGESNKRPQRKLLTKVLRNLSVEDPDLALQSALNDPMGRFGHGLEPYVVSKVAQVNTDKAISMLSHVREGTTKVASYRSVGRALAENGEFGRAVDLGGDLPDEQQSNYYCAVFSRWARANPGQLLKSMDQLPSSLAKSQAAYNLLAKHRRSGMLNDDEVEKLQDIVDAAGDTLTTIAVGYAESNGNDYQDLDLQLLERELESIWNDGAERVFELVER